LNDEQGTPEDGPEEEDSVTKAERVTAKLRGLLKEELAEYGGCEAFLRRMRSEGEENAQAEPVRTEFNLFPSESAHWQLASRYTPHPGGVSSALA
jgi:hypothetical protein